MMMNIRNISRKVLSDGWTKLVKITFLQLRRDGTWQDGIAREVYERGAAAAVLPYDKTRKTVLLVRQLRIPVLLMGEETPLLEACAGMINEGETPFEAMVREGEEELGYRFSGLEEIASAFVSPGYSTEKLHLFLASYTKDDFISSGGGLAIEGEDIEIVEMDYSELLSQADRGEIFDLKTLYLIEALRRKLA